jgi:hypothetical protein
MYYTYIGICMYYTYIGMYYSYIGMYYSYIGMYYSYIGMRYHTYMRMSYHCVDLYALTTMMIDD